MRRFPWLEALTLAAVGGLVAFGTSEALAGALAESAGRAGELVRTAEEVEVASWTAFACWAVGIGAFAVGRWLGARRDGAIAGASWLAPLLGVATGLGLVLQIGYGDPLHADGWPGARFADGVLLGGLASGVLLALPIDLGHWIERGHAALVAGIAAAFAALALFGTGPEGSDARIALGPFQPLELVKLAFVLFLAGYLGRRASSVRFQRHDVWGGLLRIPRPRLLLPALGVLALLFGGLFLVKDLGPTLVLSAVFLVVLFFVVRSTGWILIAVGSVAAAIAAVATHPDLVGSARVATRLQMWLHPWLNGLPNGDQLASSRWAIASGGLGGLGLGQGMAIPAGHTDLAVAHLAEELGFLGVAAYLAAMAGLVGLALRVGARNRTPERAIAAAGLGVLLAAQLLVIIGGTTGYLPLTGIVAPFLSSGRTSTVVFVALVALVAKLAEGGQQRAETEVLSEISRAVHGAGLALAPIGVAIAAVLFAQGVVFGPRTTVTGAVTTLGDGTVAVRYDPRLMRIADQIRRGSLLDRHGHVIVETDAGGVRRHPIGAAMGTLVGPERAEVLRPAWSLERVWESQLRGFPELADGPAVWLDGEDQLLFAVSSREERPADRARAEAMANGARLLPLPSPDLRPVAALLRASEVEIAEIANDTASRSVRLSIDAELQRRAVETLAHWGKKGEASAAVVIDVDTGEVLARAQVPDYDPADPAWRKAVWAHDPVFTGVYGAWNDKTGPRGTLQAGSVAKLVTATAAAREGLLPWTGQGCDVQTSEVFTCAAGKGGRPSFLADGWTKPIHDHHKDKAHGQVDVVEALAVSCNVYFGQLGLALGPDPLRDVVADGLDLGWSPRFEPGAGGTRTLASTAFGQGTAAVSPLQAARLVAMVGAGGVYRECPPELALGAACDSTTLVEDAAALTPVVAGLSAVMTRGTGKGLKAPKGVRVYGKTGTADQLGLESEVPFGVEEGKAGVPHSWFVALAEREDEPACGVSNRGRLAVAVVVARGGTGRGAAAPAAMDVIEAAHELGWFDPGPVSAVAEVSR